MTSLLADLPRRYAAGERAGITSVCSAHPIVIEAALLLGAEDGAPVLIEATCNQVNQEGGYTGMTPPPSAASSRPSPSATGFPRDRLILGGDHLGPNPWKHLPAADALARARAMVDAYARAGFTKFHLDTSMGCAGEPASLPDALTAERAADLAAVAEAAADQPPVYVIGTEVPIPGGATEALDHLEVTSPAAAVETVAVHRSCLRRARPRRRLRPSHRRRRPAGRRVRQRLGRRLPTRGRARPLRRPGVDARLRLRGPFHRLPAAFELSRPLSATASRFSRSAPALTFALREALYGLDHIAAALDGERAALQHVDGRCHDREPRPLAEIPAWCPGRPPPRAPLRLLGPHPLLLARARGPSRRLQRLLARLARSLHSRDPGQPVPRQASTPRSSPAISVQRQKNLAIAAIQRVLKQYRFAGKQLPDTVSQ